ncbi:MAG: acyl carrier protein [Myxococcales bacterium]
MGQGSGQGTVREQVRGFIESNFYLGDTVLEDEASLLEKGIVDSTGVLEVIAFLESAFGVVVADDETTPENLDSISGIAAFVARKQAAPRMAAGG